MSQVKIISNIQKVRSLNNKYWMDILRVAFKYAPKQSSKIIKKINANDKKISALISKLSK
tara:strand:- start:986 stop:1165 length:180 start_codon:yes stop_codon:yes gene_type:complete